jgi:hypothetical protein
MMLGDGEIRFKTLSCHVKALHTCDNRVRRCDRRDNVLDNALSEGPRHTFNSKLVGALGGNFEEPADMIWIIGIQFKVWVVSRLSDGLISEEYTEYGTHYPELWAILIH